MMDIDWNQFTPWRALAGGALIGLAAVLLALTLGRVAGISGIVGGLMRPVRGDVAWRAAFVGGLLLAPWVWQLALPLPTPRIEASHLTLVVAGLLVGLGTRYGAGCTSGHGVCGLSRGSRRSLVATLCFMAMGFVTAYITRHLWVS
jgi:uncharacterized protein